MKITEWIKENYLLAFALLIATALIFFRLDFQSLWLDELHTMNEANPSQSFKDIYNAVQQSEQMPPLYFYIVYFFFKIFGYTAFVARIPSAILGVCSIYAIYLLGKELYSNKAGQIAALLLAVNMFHLSYAQEARPYMLFELFTVLSFLRLVLFLKAPTIKNALIYGIFCALMIYGHFFGSFALFSQYLLLLFFLMVIEKETRLKFFFNAFISGITALVLLIPTIPIFIKVSQIKEFWIQAPTKETYINIAKEFFGYSNILEPFVILLLLVYFVTFFIKRKKAISYKGILEDKSLLSFIVLLTWLVTVIVLPVIKSYISAPIIISRYFILIVPAILLLMAIGLCELKNRYVIHALLFVFVLFSLLNTLTRKDYYTVPKKPQFREATSFIKENNKDNTPVVTSLWWHLLYFFKNDTVKYDLTDKPLDNYIKDMMADPSKIKSFWYIDGHSRPYAVSPETQHFIDNTFYVKEQYDGIDVWTKHYIIKETYKK